jgi:hypothetical protein
VKRFAWTKFAGAAAVLALGLVGCVEDKVAGGSSEVDNPIVVAFVDSTGISVSASGSLSIYLSGQNPALDPYPLLTKQVENVATIKLASTDFTQGLDTARTYNLLLIGSNGSVGALLQNLTYQPSTKRFVHDSMTVATVKVPVVPLVRYEASLSAGDTGIVRVFIPGTPFQSVVVDSSFVINGVPQGDFPLRVVGGDGSERPLKNAPEGPGPGNHHEVDTTTPPIVRPPPPPPTQNLVVFAGNDISLIAAGAGIVTSSSLIGSVQGPDVTDPRLAVLWRQISGPQNAKATIESPTSLNTRVDFPRGGAYQFVLSAVFGNQRIEDTVLVGIQAPQEQTVFITPTVGDTVYLPPPFSPYYYPPEKIVWDAHRKDTLIIDFTYDGSNWFPITYFPIESKRGLNNFDWFPQGDSASNVRLRLRNMRNEVVATSPLFLLRYRPFNFMKSRNDDHDEAQGNAAGYEDGFDDFFGDGFGDMNHGGHGWEFTPPEYHSGNPYPGDEWNTGGYEGQGMARKSGGKNGSTGPTPRRAPWAKRDK